MMQENCEIFLFQNIRQVILAERWCVDSRIAVRVLPVPRPYSTECGMCLEINVEDGNKLEKFASDNGMAVQRVRM